MTCHSILSSGRSMVYRTTPLMEKRKEARKKRLLEVAVRLFGRKGFHATTVPAIVKAAGTSTGNFYFYFRNKEDIYAAALQQIGEDISAALNAAIAAAAPGVLRQMRAAVRGLVGFLAEHPEEARILIVESSGLGKHLETVRRQVVGSHTRSVEHALTAAAAQLAPLDTAVAASCWELCTKPYFIGWNSRPNSVFQPAIWRTPSPASTCAPWARPTSCLRSEVPCSATCVMHCASSPRAVASRRLWYSPWPLGLARIPRFSAWRMPSFSTLILSRSWTASSPCPRTFQR